MNESFVPSIGALYRFRTGLRVINGLPFKHPMSGAILVEVKQPRVVFHEGKTLVQANQTEKSGLFFTYPGVAFINVADLTHKYTCDVSEDLDGFFEIEAVEVAKQRPSKNTRRKHKNKANRSAKKLAKKLSFAEGAAQ